MAGDQIVDLEAVLDQAEPLFQRLGVVSLACHLVPPYRGKGGGRRGAASPSAESGG
jgi:hypothetical protein